MHRIPPKLSPEEMPSYTKERGLAVEEYQQHGSFRHLSQIKERINLLLLKFPCGLELERLPIKYHETFRKEIAPQAFGFLNLMEMLKSLYEVMDMRPEGMRERRALIAKAQKYKDNPEMKVNRNTMQLPVVVRTLLNIVNTLGGIDVETLIPEYEARTGQKLNIQKLGFDSIPAFLSHTSELLKTLKKDGRVYLVDSTVNLKQPSESKEATSAVEEVEDTQSDARALMNLRQLLEEEFPSGLRLDELYAAYEGFFGMCQEDLNYEKYGYGSLETFLAAKPNVVALLNHQGSVYALPNQPFKSPTPEQINPSCVGQVVGQTERYSAVGSLTLGRVEVVIGEVYTPQLFWVIRYGAHTSQELDMLMDRMLDFYSSPLGERYRLPDMELKNLMPVAALYQLDNNFYRALVCSMEDLKSVKLFFVDYGTICICPYDCLRLLHRQFFSLPAQAIKCSLYGFLPVNGKRKWGLKCSNRFLTMVQNQKLMAEVMDVQDTTVIQLWDISHGKDTNIGELLVNEGLATLGNPCSKKADLHTSSATSSEVPMPQITGRDLEAILSKDKSIWMSSSEMAESDGYYPVTSTPVQSHSSFASNSCNCVAEQYTQSHFDEMFLNESCLVQPLDSTLSRTLRVIKVDSMLYILDVDLPYISPDQVEYLGVTLRKESDPDIYLSLVEGGFDVFDPRGKLRSSIIIYPMIHLAEILANRGYNVRGCTSSKAQRSKELQ